MRNVIFKSNIAVTIILAMTFLVVISFRPNQQMLYPLIRAAALTKMDIETRNMQKLETDHFIIKYAIGDAKSADIVAEAAEEAYLQVIVALGYVPPKKTMVVVYPSKQEMTKQFGQIGSEGAMGVYWGGMIQVLAPNVWLKPGQTTAEYIAVGPMVHEFTHLVFDYMTNGNYPRWFTEGLAQYMEYKAHGYEWITPQNNLTGNVYNMQELEASFDNLSNQSLAYRQSLAAVRYIVEVHGEDSLQKVIAELQQGTSMAQAINKVLNMSYSEYNEAWPKWAKLEMKNK